MMFVCVFLNFDHIFFVEKQVEGFGIFHFPCCVESITIFHMFKVLSFSAFKICEVFWFIITVFAKWFDLIRGESELLLCIFMSLPQYSCFCPI